VGVFCAIAIIQLTTTHAAHLQHAWPYRSQCVPVGVVGSTTQQVRHIDAWQASAVQVGQLPVIGVA
jgi:hypothetical protein